MQTATETTLNAAEFPATVEPEVTEAELLALFDQIFETGANEVSEDDLREMFPDYGRE